jgi:hypothetical protein
MTMLTELKFTEARNQFTSVIDRVQRLSPVVVKPRKQSESNTYLLNEVLIQQLLEGVTFRVEAIREENGSLTLALDELELYANGETEEEAFEALAGDLIAYAEDYMNDPYRYLSAPNRRPHFPYLFKALLCSSKDEVKQMLKDAKVRRS